MACPLRLLLVALIRRELRIRDALAAKLRHGFEEKETLLKELHHRVKSNLQVVASLLGLASTLAGID